jgi:hypothetical protein
VVSPLAKLVQGGLILLSVCLNIDTVSHAACDDLRVEVRQQLTRQRHDQPRFSVHVYSGDEA